MRAEYPLTRDTEVLDDVIDLFFTPNSGIYLLIANRLVNEVVSNIGG